MVIGLTGIPALEAEMRDRLAAKDAETLRLRTALKGVVSAGVGLRSIDIAIAALGEELDAHQATVEAPVVVGAVTVPSRDLQREVRIFIRGIMNAAKFNDDVVTSCRTLYQRFDIKEMEEMLASGFPLKSNEYDHMVWFDGVSLGALRYIAARVTAEPLHSGGGSALEDHNLLSERNRLREALEKIERLTSLGDCEGVMNLRDIAREALGAKQP